MIVTDCKAAIGSTGWGVGTLNVRLEAAGRAGGYLAGRRRLIWHQVELLLLPSRARGTALLVGQSHETAIAKRLASWATILAVPTAIAGIYGMNFKNMPELEMQFGYYTVIVAIFALCGILFWRFRKNGWL